MKVYTNKWYYWIWEHTYDSRVPEDGCLFLKKMGLAVLMFIPFTILTLPLLMVLVIGNLFVKDKKSKEGFPVLLANGTLALGIVSWLATVIIFCMFGMFFYDLSGNILQIKSGIVRTGITGWVITLAVFLCVIADKIIKANKRRKANKIEGIEVTKEPSMLSQAYHAFKDKYCPKVEVIRVNKDNETTS